MPKQQKTHIANYLQTSVLQCQKYAFVFCFCQKARPNGFDFLTCLVERLYLGYFDYLTDLVKSLCLGATNSPTDRPANRYKLRDNSEITRR